MAFAIRMANLGSLTQAEILWFSEKPQAQFAIELLAEAKRTDSSILGSLVRGIIPKRMKHWALCAELQLIFEEDDATSSLVLEGLMIGLKHKAQPEIGQKFLMDLVAIIDSLSEAERIQFWIDLDYIPNLEMGLFPSYLKPLQIPVVLPEKAAPRSGTLQSDHPVVDASQTLIQTFAPASDAVSQHPKVESCGDLDDDLSDATFFQVFDDALSSETSVQDFEYIEGPSVLSSAPWWKRFAGWFERNVLIDPLGSIPDISHSFSYS